MVSRINSLALALALVSSCSAFTHPTSRVVSHSNFAWKQHQSQTKVFATTLEAPVTTKEEESVMPVGWECDEEANCVQVPACDEEQCRTTLDVRIHGEWYDLSGWRKAHPAGAHWIDWYDGRDATEVMDAFHSEKGRQMYQRLPKSTPETAAALAADIEPDTSTQIAFRELREQLEKDGWWERDMVHEAKLLGIWFSLVAGSAVLAHDLPVLSSMLAALSMTNAGWLGHDYIHGVDKFSDKMRNFAGVAAGLGPTWWSDKHNKHHALSEFLETIPLFKFCLIGQSSKDKYQTNSLSCCVVFFGTDKQQMRWVSMKILQQTLSFLHGHLIRSTTHLCERFSI
uniref:Cytochrome b5 heme-binding domain-containing protein n=1 Tax=Ditylum brightwellii TaxID=49249 RepID=A0A7S4T0U5_9STRA